VRPGLGGSLDGLGLLVAAPRPRGRAPLSSDRRGRRGQASSRSCRGASTSRAGGARGALGWRTLSARASPTRAGTGWATPRRCVPFLPCRSATLNKTLACRRQAPPVVRRHWAPPAGSAGACSAPHPATVPPALRPSSFSRTCASVHAAGRLIGRRAGAGDARGDQGLQRAAADVGAPAQPAALQRQRQHADVHRAGAARPRLRARLHPCALSCTTGCRPKAQHGVGLAMYRGSN